MAASTKSLDVAQHIRYWQRCFNSHLPSLYTPNDSTRLTFASFIVSALELLSSPLSAEDRTSIQSWVLSLQHPDGGFCGSPTHMLPGQDAFKGSANLAATFFALLLLAIAADSDAEARAAFARVRRRKLLRWLRRLQRQDGSFGQVLWEGEAVGGRDMRHSYLASCIRWMLRGGLDKDQDPAGHEDDIDVGRMVHHIRHTQTYDGGVAEASEHESHAGYAYCAIGALYMLDRPPSWDAPHKSSFISQTLADKKGLVQFLVHRQFNYLAEQESRDLDGDGENFIETKLGDLGAGQGCTHVGWNGRWNKKADTCYSWWVAATLAMVDSCHAVNIPASRRYLLEMTQQKFGGFSKCAGGHPDLYHSYLGLAALAVMVDDDLKQLDVALCCSKETVRKVQLARDGLLDACREREDFGSDGFWESQS